MRLFNFAVLFLAIASFFEFLCILLYAFVFPKLPIVRYFRKKAASEGSKTVAADLAAARDEQEVLFYMVKLQVHGKHWKPLSYYYVLIFVCYLLYM